MLYEPWLKTKSCDNKDLCCCSTEGCCWLNSMLEKTLLVMLQPLVWYCLPTCIQKYFCVLDWLLVEKSVVEKCRRGVLEKSVGGDCWRRLLEKSVVAKSCREVLETLQLSSTTLFSNTPLQHFSTTLFSTTLLYNTLLHHSSPTVSSNTRLT